MDKRGGRDTSGYHTPKSPQNKLFVDWYPRRGGKKARKQANLFQSRLFVQFLIYHGIISGVEEEGKGFEKSFGKGLASGSSTVVTSESSVAVPTPRSVETVVTSDSSAAVPNPKAHLIETTVETVDDPEEEFPLFPVLSKAPSPSVVGNPYIDPVPVPKVGSVTIPKGGIHPISPATSPRPSVTGRTPTAPPLIPSVSSSSSVVPTVPKKARPEGTPGVSHFVAPKTPPKNPPSVGPVPKTPPKSPVVPPRVVQNPRAALKPKLSGPVVDLSSGDGGSGLVSTAASAPPGEVRVSIDYNQTSNVNGLG